MTLPILAVEHLSKIYPLKQRLFQPPLLLKAVSNLSFEIFPGETVSIVGESGCGKSTLGRLLLQIEPATSGKIVFQGKEIKSSTKQELKNYWKKVQLIFQNPYSSLNPRWKIKDILAEPLRLQTALSPQEIREKLSLFIEQVGLLPEHLERYPHQFSGGQRQRIGIARALALRPDLLVCDEPVSALDVSVQSQVLNLLMDLQVAQPEHPLTYLFIAHDLGVVEHISDRIFVMYLGRFVETGTREQIFETPKHPYTQALLGAIPKIDPEKKRKRILLEGELPSPLNPPSGCTFRTRCLYAREECASVSMELQKIEEQHFSACPYSSDLHT